MSATQTFAYCRDCREMHYAVTDKSGVYSRESVSSNHFGHDVHVFGAPDQCPAPIRNVLTKLQAMAPIGHNELVLFKLAIDLGGLEELTV